MASRTTIVVLFFDPIKTRIGELLGNSEKHYY